MELERLTAAGEAAAADYAIVLSLLVRKRLLDDAVTLVVELRGVTAVANLAVVWAHVVVHSKGTV